MCSFDFASFLQGCPDYHKLSGWACAPMLTLATMFFTLPVNAALYVEQTQQSIQPSRLAEEVLFFNEEETKITHHVNDSQATVTSAAVLSADLSAASPTTTPSQNYQSAPPKPSANIMPNDTPTASALQVSVSEASAPEDDGWLDDVRGDTKRWLNRTAHHLDGLFGRGQNAKPAEASLRVMVDMHRHADGTEQIKPRIRGKLRLPTLEQRLSVVIGDDSVDYQGDVIGQGAETATSVDQTVRFDRQQSRKENSSLALRWSRLLSRARLLGDIDVGVRSGDDVYLRLRAHRTWALGDDWQGEFEQIYRYGTDSQYYARSHVQLSQPRGANRRLVNHSYLEYTQQTDERLRWGNNTYQAHTWASKHGMRELSYGVHLSGRVDDARLWHSYGPFVHYRQPVWREWFFVQSELSYYNDFAQQKPHRLAAFVRLEMVF